MSAANIRLGQLTESASRRTPVYSLLLANAAMAPIILGAISVFFVRPAWAAAIIRLDCNWSGALLCFFAGVNRGLSFRQPGGPAFAQFTTMFWLFLLGMSALLSPWQAASLVLLVAGFASMIIIGPAAAWRAEAPRYFARLRPWQMLFPVASLCVLLLKAA
jgi:hypothetical protein